MKKIISLITMVILAACVSLPCEAQSKALIKARQKEAKNKIKEYNKEGWKLFGTGRSIEVAVLEHNEKLNNLGDKGFELFGTSVAEKSKNAAHIAAVNNASMSYAQKASSIIKGRITNEAGLGNAEIDNMYAAYETMVMKEIKGEMIESYCVIRENKDGKIEMQAFFVVNEDAASKARMRAWENAMKESEAAQKYANKVSDFIKEGFSTE